MKALLKIRDRTTVGGHTQVLPIQFENGHVVRFAEVRCTPGNDLQHRLQFSRRSADDLKNLFNRSLLYKGLIALAGEYCNARFDIRALLTRVSGRWPPSWGLGQRCSTASDHDCATCR